MKGSIMTAAVAALAGSASAAAHAHRRAHEIFARGAKGTGLEECIPGCTTIWSTYYGEPTMYYPHTSPTSTPCVVPTPQVEKCPTPGTYTFPATTITLTEETTVCAPATTKVPKGTHTYGGVITVVETSTTVVCPYAKETTQNGVVTSVIEMTTTVCPSAGTYTIAPTSTTVTVEETVIVYPCVSSYKPGTYTKEAATVTVTETDYVTVCPFTGGPTSAPAPAPAPVSSSTPEKSTTPKVSKPGNSGQLSGGGADHWAITYTPYKEDASGGCKSADAVDADIAKIAGMGFNTVRIYSTDCDTLENVTPACRKYGIKMIIGVFVKGSCDMSGFEGEQVEKIAAWGKAGNWDLVSAVVIGNEAIFQGLCTGSSLAGFISSCKSTFEAAGYSAANGHSPIFTTAETVNIWQEHGSSLCDLIDVVGCNIHAFFDAGVAPSGAGDFVASQLSIASNVCGGKRSVALECGWPSQGDQNGKAIASHDAQKTAIDSIKGTCGSDVVFFTFGYSYWKNGGSCNCEPYFNVDAAF